jgi:hypothetical protein
MKIFYQIPHRNLYLSLQNERWLNLLFGLYQSKHHFERVLDFISQFQKSLLSNDFDSLEWEEHDVHGKVYIVFYSELATLYGKSDKLIIEPNGDYLLNSKEYPISVILKIVEKYIDIFKLWESDEAFPTYSNLLKLIQKKYHRKVTSWGFRLISQFDNAVLYKKDWLILNFLEDQEGPVLYLIDERSNQKYDFNLALELLDHYAATIHSMLYQKYKLKLSREETRSGYFVKTMEFLESHLLDKIQGPDETFIRELEKERQLRNKMLQKVLTLPQDHPIKQRFLNEDNGWWDAMKEEMGNDS